ncbi:MAG: RNA polymerase sigma factor [Oscillospiraceae bacterium]|nr:RNA polymerase sigma factor [Oscillospiraceae bacterium]
MEDEKIIALFFDRDEQAIFETREKYGPYCTAIAYNILSSFEDTEECVSDTYLRTWNSIPPNCPRNLKGYMGRITHNLALTMYRRRSAKKRSVITEVLEELQIPSLEDLVETAERKETARLISDFLRALPAEKRRIFVLRYWYYETIPSISRTTGWKETRIKSELSRIRKKLKKHLEQEGVMS